MTQDIGAENSTTQLATFREAKQEQVEEPIPSVRVEGEGEVTEINDDVDPEFSIYEKITGKPYSSSYFGLDEKYNHLAPNDTMALKEIDTFIRETMKSKHLKDDKAVARNILSDIEFKLGLTSENEPYYRIDKIIKYIKVMGVDA